MFLITSPDDNLHGETRSKFLAFHAVFEGESIRKSTGKHCRVASFCLALFIASHLCFGDRPDRAKDPTRLAKSSVRRSSSQYPWKINIITTVFWIGEQPGGHNLTPNRTSSWDKHWAENYGGFDDPNAAHRKNYIPVKFTPRQNPFYCALPYNDKAHTGHQPEAPRVVPWFAEAYQGPAVSTCKDRWVAIRKGNRTAYAQWEDAGPFRTDHWQYVFGDERPKPNLNRGAGLDVSPAVRDYLGLQETDVTDWRFVEFSEVPRGPWSTMGENNTFVINSRKKTMNVAEKLRPNRQGVSTR